MLDKVLRLFNTLRYLKPTQLFYFILRRKFPARTVYASNNSQSQQRAWSRPLQLSRPIAIGGTRAGSNQIEFLNHARSFDLDNIDWCPIDAQRLWQYNLHYFDYLRDDDWSVAEKTAMLSSWIDGNAQATQPGWEPFTCSLRIVNWILFLDQQRDAINHCIIDSLYTQTCWLEKNDERHILANHYFENLKALLFAGCFFSADIQGSNGKVGNDSKARHWVKKATQGIAAQLNEQTLADGGHYERSPQYHCLMLENYLDIYNLVLNNKALFETAFSQQLEQIIQRSIEWLSDIVFPDGKIPLLNDSAWGTSPTLAELLDYGQRLDITLHSIKSRAYSQAGATTPLNIIDKPDTGLYGVKTGADMLLMDCGDIGPSYQPGHTHCDFLSYELMLGGRRLVVDTGVCEYQPGELRQYVRSTRAHNTVSVDGLEQSEVWGEFRVARRAKKHHGAVVKNNKTIEVSGSYAGFYVGRWGFAPSFTHRREVYVKLVKDAFESIEVVDTLGGVGEHLLESFIHIHPDFTLEPAANNRIRVLCDGHQFAWLTIDTACQFKIESAIYCPEFGLKHTIDCVVMSCRASLPQSISYRFERR